MVKIPLSGLKTVIFGGDRRESILAQKLLEKGASVTMIGFSGETVPPSAAAGEEPDVAVSDAQVLILPLAGTDEQGFVRAVSLGKGLQLKESHLGKMRPGGLVIVGNAQNFLKNWCRVYHLQLMEIGERDDLAILNAVPTAEGAIQLAMQETDTTIFGSPCAVLGMGRVGTVLTRTLKAMGADVTVVERDAGKRALAQTMGCKAVSFEALEQILGHTGVVFNTVPALVLSREVLRTAHPELLVIDLATRPGGTDFEAAADYGIKAVLAPGLPGKIAPYSAGCILSDIVLPLIMEHQMKAEQKKKQEGSV